MGKGKLQLSNENRIGFLSFSDLSNQWSNLQDEYCPPVGGLFASVGVNGVGFGAVSPNPIDSNNKNSSGNKDMIFPYADLYAKYMPKGLKIGGVLDPVEVEEEEEDESLNNNKKKKGVKKFKVKVANPSLRRLISGAIAGAVSRTAVAPLETIRTHLMVGTSGNSSTEVFNDIMKADGWTGLFRGNFVNVIRVAPSKAIELLAFDTVNKHLSHKPGEQSKIPIPSSLVAGACAGVTSTLFTYPLELVKTRITIERGVYDGVFDAFVKILKEGGPGELYRGLAPSLIGVIPYAATNYFAYDTLRKAYRKIVKQEKIGNIETLIIGSLAGAISSTATFPLEVARKQMQVGALSGRQVYKNLIHALASILEQEGVSGLYRGLGPSCVKLVPAAGISFMCYEACKKILVDNEDEA